MVSNDCLACYVIVSSLSNQNNTDGSVSLQYDLGLARFQAMRVSNFEHFKPTGRSFKIGMLTVVLPIVGYAWMLKRERDAREAQYRTGQVAYKDRRFKFI